MFGYEGRSFDARYKADHNFLTEVLTAGCYNQRSGTGYPWFRKDCFKQIGGYKRGGPHPKKNVAPAGLASWVECLATTGWILDCHLRDLADPHRWDCVVCPTLQHMGLDVSTFYRAREGATVFAKGWCGNCCGAQDWVGQNGRGTSVGAGETEVGVALAETSHTHESHTQPAEKGRRGQSIGWVS